jgi:hypothetical protein
MTKNTWEEIENRKKAKNRLNQRRTRQQKAKARAEYTEIYKRVKKSVRKKRVRSYQHSNNSYRDGGNIFHKL